jgi:hypothetical protein
MLPPDGYRLVFGLSNRRIGMLRVRDTCDGSQIPSQSRPTPASPRPRSGVRRRTRYSSSCRERREGGPLVPFHRALRGGLG